MTAKDPKIPPGWAIGIARSSDLDSWEKIGEILPEQEPERNGLCAPGAIVLDGRVHLFYQTYGNGPKDAICHAVSEDGLAFPPQPHQSDLCARPARGTAAGRSTPT